MTIDMTLMEVNSKNGAEEALLALIKGNREAITDLIRQKLKPGEAVEYILAKGMVPVGPKEFQGAEARIKKMSVVDRLMILDRIAGHRKIMFAETIGGRHLAFTVRTAILKAN